MITIHSEDGLTLTATIKDDGKPLLVRMFRITGRAGISHFEVELYLEELGEKDEVIPRTIKGYIASGFDMKVEDKARPQGEAKYAQAETQVDSITVKLKTEPKKPSGKFLENIPPKDPLTCQHTNVDKNGICPDCGGATVKRPEGERR